MCNIFEMFRWWEMQNNDSYHANKLWIFYLFWLGQHNEVSPSSFFIRWNPGGIMILQTEEYILKNFAFLTLICVGGGVVLPLCFPLITQKR